MPARPPKLGILAGGGALPARLVAACRESGRDVFVVAHEGISDRSAVENAEHEWVNLGAVQRTIAALREQAVEEIVLAGPVRRPSLTSLRLDRRAIKALVGIGGGQLGDNRLLSRIVAVIESEGFRVVGIDDILTELVTPTGAIGAVAPDDGARADIATGCRVAKALGALDIGQAVVTQQGMVLGVEAVEGTDALLARCAGLRREGPGGVLVKLKKPGQEGRADLPTIGPGTVERAREAGLVGIAIEAGGSLIIDRPAVAAAADAAGLFVVGIAPDEL
ncbi:MAG: UDP-2,3-diacylglucosamine diphosphatase LpxI [Proteobacteria bacterium]|nr:UDP-2,3-diacylglucosamine diphosphatase LpxI [Pseudomonadota bacterium]